MRAAYAAIRMSFPYAQLSVSASYLRGPCELAWNFPRLALSWPAPSPPEPTTIPHTLERSSQRSLLLFREEIPLVCARNPPAAPSPSEERATDRLPFRPA